MVFDTGAANSSFNHLKWFTELHPLPRPVHYSCSSGTIGTTYYQGTVELNTTTTKGDKMRLKLPHTNYCPESPANLVGIVSLRSSKSTWRMDTNDIIHKPSGRIIQCTEFTNLTPAGRSAIWINNLCDEYGVKQGTPLVLFTDSENALATVLNPMNKARTRCIDIRYKWIIDEVVNKKEITLIHVSGKEMPADGLTKPLPLDLHVKFVKMLGMQSMKVPWYKD